MITIRWRVVSIRSNEERLFSFSTNTRSSLAAMLSSILFDYDFQITLCVIFSLGAVASIWGAIFSPYIFDWIGVELEHEIKGRNWPKRFLISLILQPITFAAAAIALWWYPLVVIIPPIHFFATIFCLIVIDVTRPEEPWEKGYQRLF